MLISPGHGRSDADPISDLGRLPSLHTLQAVIRCAAMTDSFWSADERNDFDDANTAEEVAMEEMLWESAEGVEAAEPPLSATPQEP